MYATPDGDLFRAALVASREQQQKERDFFSELKEKADNQAKRVSAKAHKAAERNYQKLSQTYAEELSQVPHSERQQVLSHLAEQVKKRKRSKTGLISSLIARGHISREHVNQADGSLHIDELRKTEYFKRNAHLLDVLGDYQLSKRSKLRQERKSATVTTVRPQQPVQDMPMQTESVRYIREEPPKRRSLMRAGGVVAAVVALAGVAIHAQEEEEAVASDNVAAQVDRTHLDNWLAPENNAVAQALKLPKPSLKLSVKVRRDEVEAQTGGVMAGKLQRKHSERFYIFPRLRKVEKGDTLSSISQTVYGKSRYWPIIAGANHDKISDPNKIYPKQRLRLPEIKNDRGHLEATVHKRKGKHPEKLGHVARRKHISRERLVRANRDSLGKENHVYVGQELDVPVKPMYKAKETASYSRTGTRRVSYVTEGYANPVSGCTPSSDFGPREAPKPGASTYHEGLDMAAGIGTRVNSVAEGKVVFVGSEGGYGNIIKVLHKDGTTTAYAHLSAFHAQVNEHVSPGEDIGAVGVGGTGPHLHFEVRVNGVNGKPIDPDPWLRGKGVVPCVSDSLKRVTVKRVSYKRNTSPESSTLSVKERLRRATIERFGVDGWPSVKFIMSKENAGYDPHIYNQQETFLPKNERACGIPQAKPCTKLLNEIGNDLSNVRGQIEWMMDYIDERYGSPQAAEAFWHAHGWY